MPGRFLIIAFVLPCVAVSLLPQPVARENAWAITAEGQVWDLPSTVPNAPALIKSLGDAAEYVLRWKVPREIDLGTVIPSALQTLDVPDLVALVAPRKVLYCQARDASEAGNEALVARFRRVSGAAGGNCIRYDPEQSLDGLTLHAWLQRGGGR